MIYTENEGERFVPGYIVETSEGPRFAPARVVENDDGKVTFIPGAVVDTPDGPRFVAPDLKDCEEGDFEFSVQSFMVTPEELALIKPHNTWFTTNSAPGELSIDAQMLRQLSEAGMSIGRQVESTAVDYVLQSTLDREIVEKFCEAHSIGIEAGETLFKMIKVLSEDHKGKISGENLNEEIMKLCLPMLADCQSNGNDTETKVAKRRVNAIANQASETNQIVNILTKVMIDVLKNEQNCVTDGSLNRNAAKNDSIYEVIASVLNGSVKQLNVEQLQHTFATANGTQLLLEKLGNTIEKVETLCQIEEMKQSLMGSVLMMNGNSKNSEKVGKGKSNKTNASKNSPKNNVEILINDQTPMVDQFCSLIADQDISSAFKVMTQSNPQLLMSVLNAVQANSDPTANIKEILQHAIITAVNKTNEENISEIFTTGNKQNIEAILNETLVLAKVLGLNSEAITILAALDRCNSPNNMQLDEATKSLIGRVCVIRKLAENNPEYKQALETLHQTPSRAVKDEKLRELVRKSGLISIEPVQKSSIETSHDIPISLLMDENILAMEDFMLRQGSGSKAFLIIKKGLQCVVPREKSHDVLTGKCAYSVLDENGIRHFEPLHVMSALNLNTPSSHHRFSIYSSDMPMDEQQQKIYQQQKSTDIKYLQCEVQENASSDGSSENGEDAMSSPPRSPRFGKSNSDPQSLIISQEQLNKKRRITARKTQNPFETKVYRQYKQCSQGFYLLHAYVYHSKA